MSDLANAKTEELMTLAAFGAGLQIDASSRQVQDIMRIAASAAKSGARLEITNVGGLNMADLKKIAAAGKGTVSFR